MLSFPIDVLALYFLGTYPSLQIGQETWDKRKERARQALKKSRDGRICQKTDRRTIGWTASESFYCKSSSQGADMFLDEPFVGD